MSNLPKGLNDIAWERLFEKYSILDKVDAQGSFEISATQIKELREPRLMVKFDHLINLPKLFSENQLAILPITRGDYIISHFDAYHKFEPYGSEIKRVSLPSYIQSIDSTNIYSEVVALNSAVIAGIVADFLQDEELVSTVSGRMSSGTFTFDIADLNRHNTQSVHVKNSQIEIDAAYEGVQGLTLFEAKMDLSDDFLIRQLYYPFRLWQSRVTKPVRLVFLIYSNGIYRLYEYAFQNIKCYNSLILTQQQNYSVEDTTIKINDIESVLRQIKTEQEPNIPFPQADSFERVINLCEILKDKHLYRNEVTEQYAFDVRQTNYYTDAARYLGLLEKKKEGQVPIYTLSDKGLYILNLNYKQRQLEYCKSILSHKAFAEVLQLYLKKGNIPTTEEIASIMRQSNLYNIDSDSTFERRSQTVKSWLNWIISLISE